MIVVLRSVLAAFIAAMLSGAAYADAIDISGLPPHERCARCHGLDGNSFAPLFPRLAGQSVAYVKKQLSDFRSGRRTNDKGGMSGIAETLSEADTNEVALYFAKQTPRAMAGDARGNPDAGRKIYVRGKSGVAACASCHSSAARGATGAPLIAGQHADYLEKQLLDFKGGKRRNDAMRVMRRIAGALKDSEIRALAKFLSRENEASTSLPSLKTVDRTPSARIWAQ